MPFGYRRSRFEGTENCLQTRFLFGSRPPRGFWFRSGRPGKEAGRGRRTATGFRIECKTVGNGRNGRSRCNQQCAGLAGRNGVRRERRPIPFDDLLSTTGGPPEMAASDSPKTDTRRKGRSLFIQINASTITIFSTPHALLHPPPRPSISP
jgi:hypothetical protein